jgi:hypothetical protein
MSDDDFDIEEFNEAARTLTAKLVRAGESFRLAGLRSRATVRLTEDHVLGFSKQLYVHSVEDPHRRRTNLEQVPIEIRIKAAEALPQLWKKLKQLRQAQLDSIVEATSNLDKWIDGVEAFYAREETDGGAA